MLTRLNCSIGLSILLACVSAGYVFADTENAVITLEVKHESYLAGEPIALSLRIKNQQTKSLYFDLGYPHFVSQLAFESQSGELQRQDEILLDFRSAWLKVNANQEQRVTLYLQRFFRTPKPGRYQITYAVKLPYTANPDDSDGLKQETKAEGVLSFEILPANTDKLTSIFADYAQGLVSDDHWEQAQSLEALRCVDDPLAVPHLVKGLGQTAIASLALATLGRYRDVPEASEAVVKTLDSERELMVLDALRILQEWKFALPEAKLAELKKHGNSEVAKLAQRYGE